MNLNKLRVTIGILLSVIIITTQSSVYAVSYSTALSDPGIFSTESTAYNSVSGIVIPQKKYAISNMNQLGQVKPVPTELGEAKSHILVDSKSDSALIPISIPSECITSYEMGTDGYVNVEYILDGIQFSGKYLEEDIRRTLHETPLDSLLNYHKADEVATSLGLDTLKRFAEASSEEIIIAVIDTGVDINHSLLKDRLVRGYDVIDDDYIVVDDVGHGTHVAGIIALSTSDNVKIMPIDVFEDDSALDSSIVEGIYYAVKNGAKIINLSLGGYGKTTYLENSINFARKNGVMVIASSGNDAHDNQFDYPAAFDEVITVGATNNSGTLLYYSNHGESVDISAPGEKIVSAYLDNSTESLSGTSMAAPFVCAAAAMLWLDKSGSTLEQVEESLFENTKDLGPSGKDIAFGHGEIDYSNYKSDENFYMIGHFTDLDHVTSEFKYDLPLRYFVGENVKSISFTLDNKSVHNVNQGYGVIESNLNIRDLSNGSHTLSADIVFKDGHTEQVFNSAFVIPEYNVRIRVFDLYGEEITINSKKGMTGYLIRNSEFNIFREFKSLWSTKKSIQMNIDFTKESEKNLYYYASHVWDSEDIPTYLRGLYTSGDYLLEPSESIKVTYESDLPLEPGFWVSYDLPTVLEANVTDNNVRWNGYQMWLLNETYYQGEKNVDSGITEFDFYYDQHDFYIKAKGVVEEPNKRSRIQFFSYFNSGMDMTSITNEDTNRLNVKFDSVAVPYCFFLSNLYTGSQDANYTNFSDTFLPKGIYKFYAVVEQVLNDKQSINYIFENKIDFMSKRNLDIRIGDTLESQLWINVRDHIIQNKWTDANGNRITINLANKGELYVPIIPNLVLKNIESKKEIQIKGSRSFGFELVPEEIYGTDAYELYYVPDGTYEVEFEFETAYKPFKINHAFTIIKIQNGQVVSEKNTEPKSIDYLNITIPPLEELSLDLTHLFWDNEQKELFFNVTEGIVLNNTFYYQDILKKDKTIEITAYDGVGGSTKLNLQLLIGDTFAIENDFIPIKDIITIGASYWSVQSIQKAIDQRIVNNDILEDYQTSINRLEISEQLVKIIEKNKGRLSTSKSISFFDTQNEAALKLASISIMGGLGNGIFGPEKNITRQELAVILYKAAQIMTGKTLFTTNAVHGYSDWNTVSSWAKESLTFCVNNNILTGSNGKLAPKGNVTREQAIVMLVKLYDGVEAKTLK